MATRVLIIEDEKVVGEAIAEALLSAGFEPRWVRTLADAPDPEGFAAVVLDRMLPDGDGLELLDVWKGCGMALPVVVLTGRTGLADRLDAFEAGAIDWLPKPFFPQELVARLRARIAPAGAGPLVSGGLAVDPDTAEVRVQGEAVSLTPQQLAMLVLLMRRAGRVTRRSQLSEASERTVDSQIARLRQHLGPEGARIRTIRGLGYRFD
ncbi:MAG: response regulator transcription factor [Myxococcales bacterium]|nr:response regulator transcription factor [Myxococcales bacterium]